MKLDPAEKRARAVDRDVRRAGRLKPRDVKAGGLKLANWIRARNHEGAEIETAELRRMLVRFGTSSKSDQDRVSAAAQSALLAHADATRMRSAHVARSEFYDAVRLLSMHAETIADDAEIDERTRIAARRLIQPASEAVASVQKALAIDPRRQALPAIAVTTAADLGRKVKFNEFIVELTERGHSIEDAAWAVGLVAHGVVAARRTGDRAVDPRKRAERIREWLEAEAAACDQLDGAIKEIEDRATARQSAKPRR